MTTDYKNLTLFEVAAICMIVVGLGLISLQLFLSTSAETQAEISGVFQIFEMSGAATEVYGIADTIHDTAVASMNQFYNEFYVAMVEVLYPIGEDAEQLAQVYHSVVNGMMDLSETVASNYEKNYYQSGVESGGQGQVMGAFIEKLSN